MSIAKLLIAASEHDADMLYVSGMFVPDAFIAIGLEEQGNICWHGLFSPLEVDRARKQSRFEQVHLDSDWRKQASDLGFPSSLVGVAAAFIKARGIAHIEVPGHFPLMYARTLEAIGFSVSATDGSMFPQRICKRPDELKQLARAERLTRQSMQQARAFLAECSIGDDGILRQPQTQQRLKAKDVRAVIETFLISKGAMPAHTIVACGKEAADPHNIGAGFIRARQPIIIDIFPRLLDSGYWGDMTRTFVKGKAPDHVKKLYQTVREGQDIGLAMIAAGVHGQAIHTKIQAHFEQCGFTTGIVRGKQTGFFHGTGHGVGLEIHEAPRISVRDDELQENQVVTVEPGLYYPGLGGVRLEDMVVVKNNGHENLTNYQRQLEIE
ncbi:MAG: hypothetical protein CO186_07985 [Zetaproteobacteria bacterium CG_4_9_14_3_um_filter_49_83]|nr:MAG: hypothetical protein AUJ56_08200 [Zetaproteobacteria bacterium CG1_02_49_23]PIQ34093.1 MAG: hypothetical protein COW62_03355 [Zetaproteobacteria bacterium CG17_big_fil_post_rev_8_21_14_2_50_50_13]PIY55859.1 MAG: hypothetical protein COZ00_06985 [Zetaproteobacteria bacterium CG_4_10_14_0_8_um_filter_49_80]PJA34989.1 MAG: hypothetical protein CO186_07985 [Zetaproteobacteria bacterium CG_4_9_14_3_um_filter_49_83]